MGVLGVGGESAWVMQVMSDLACRYPAETYGLETFILGRENPPPNARRRDAIVGCKAARGKFVLTEPVVRLFANGRTARFRAVLLSPTQFDTAEVFHFVIHDDVVIVADYEFRYSGLDRGELNGYPSDMGERMLMAASLSFN